LLVAGPGACGAGRLEGGGREALLHGVWQRMGQRAWAFWRLVREQRRCKEHACEIIRYVAAAPDRARRRVIPVIDSCSQRCLP
jgi:hypothetical protein